MYMQGQKTKSHLFDIYLRLHLHEIIIHICSDLFGFRSVWIQIHYSMDTICLDRTGSI